MGGSRGLYFWRRFFLLLGSFIVCVFFSTPSAVLSMLKRVDVLKVYDTSEQWVNYIPVVGDSIVQYLPPLMVLAVNQILLVMIDIVALWEKHHSHSHYQASIFFKSVIYLNINMLLIPAISIKSAETVLVLLAEKGFSPKQMLSDLYYSDYGFFFITLIIQQGFLSSSFYVLRTADLLQNWMSPWLADYKRKFMNDQFAWRRKPQFSFQYGYFYAQ